MRREVINKDKIMELLKKDYTPLEIAEKMKISRGTVYKYIIDNDETKKPTQQECMDKAKEMLKRGCGEKEIAIETRRTMQTIKKYIQIIKDEGKVKEVREVKRIKRVEPPKRKVYEKRVISYKGWRYKMLGTWRFNIAYQHTGQARLIKYINNG